MFAKSAVFAFFAAFAAAQLHEPVGDAPQGNPITKPLLEVVNAGTPYKITWEPTSTNTISLLLLKGPSNNVVPVETIVEGLANTGSYEYTFPGSFGASDGPSGYGIQLIDDVTGFYQYSTQFGIAVPEGYSSVISSSVGPSGTGYPTSSPTGGYPTSKANATSAYPTVTKHTSSYVASTGYPVHNSSIIQPSKSLTVPSSLRTTATPTGSEPTSTQTSPPESTGAASHLSGAMGLFAGVAAMVFML